MYKRAISAFMASYPMFLMIAVLLVVVDEFIQLRTSLGARIFVTAMVAFFSHRMVLIGEKYGWAENFALRKKGADKLRIFPFVWRFSVLFLILIIITALIGWRLSSVIPKADTVGLFMVSVFIALLPYGMLLALIGTILPASAINEDASLSHAFRRGKRRFFKTLWRLVYGNFLFAMIYFATYLAMTNLLLDLGLYNGFIYYGMSFVGYMGGLLTTLLAATALSIAYEETRDCL